MSTDQTPTVFAPHMFAGRCYVVTGGGHGIGLGIVEAMLRHGANVVVIELNADFCNELRSTHGGPHESRLQVIEGDASDTATIQKAIDASQQQYSRLDGWVNNAFFSKRTLLADQPEEELQRAWNVNVMSIWRSCKLLLPVFEPAGGGSIVNIGSVMAQQTSPACAAYTATKAGLEGMTRALGVELAAKHIRVNAINPGYILTYEAVTENTPAARKRYELHLKAAQPIPEPGMPSDIANMALFLLSPAAQFITGTTVFVDGGLHCSLRDLLERNRAKAIRELLGDTPAT